MAKIAILSDIHANADAFSVVLDKCREIGAEQYISLGDIVGYNADPDTCMKMASEIKWIAMVRGNHDDCISSGDTEMSGFNENAKLAVTWTRSRLDAQQLSWLRTPFISMAPKFGATLVHATLDSPENWGYVIDVFHAETSLMYQRSALCFCGHSHIPVAFEMLPFAAGERGVRIMPNWCGNEAKPENDSDFNCADEMTVEYKAGCKYLFNIGSIGQPRNHDPRASFALLDTDKHTVTRYRLPYDIASQQNKIIDAGLPERLASRLALGV